MATEQQTGQQAEQVEGQAQRATEYVVLREVTVEMNTASEPVTAWKEYGVATARTYRDAIKAATAQPDGTNEDGKYKAVPQSSWDRGLEIDTAPRSLFKGLGGGAEDDGSAPE